MERKSSENDIYRIIKKDLVELHKTLCKHLGNRNPFAKFSIGGGFYVWADNSREWTQMTAVSSVMQSIVREAVFARKSEIAAIFNEKTAEALFTVPDESYIYFAENEGETEILVTGWGFVKPVRTAGKADVDEISKRNPIDISFTFDNETLPNYEFGLQLPKQVKHFFTDATGVYHFDDIKVGEELPLVDLKSGKNFMLKVTEGQHLYNFDVTTYFTLRMKATVGAEPIANETIDVTFHGKAYSVATNANGEAAMELPYHAHNEIAAKLRELTKREIANESGNEIIFQFEEPKKAFETDIEVIVYKNGEPCANHKVNIDYNGNTYNGVTDNNGVFRQHTIVEEDADCIITVPEYDPLTTKLKEEPVNTFKFETIDEPEVVEEPVFFNPHILILGEEGYIGKDYTIYVDYKGERREYTSDENGIVQLPQMQEGEKMTVTDSLNPTNIQEYELDHNKEEYIFNIPYKAFQHERDIKLTFQNRDEKPLLCDKVRFQQAKSDKELLSELDEEGVTYFPNDYFLNDEDIKTTIMGSEREYEPINFTLEEGENEYLFQERYKGFPWKMVLLQILAVVATIIALLVLWPFFCGIFAGMFEGIYH